MSVYQKLNQARLNFHKLPLKKTGHNKFAGYYYFELGDFLIPALEVFNELGLCAIVSFTTDVASLRIIDLDSATETTITSPMGSAALKGCHEVQNIGAVETYQRRYLWVAALEIVEHDALDAVTGADKPASAKPVTRSVFDSLDVPTQEGLRDIAMEALVFINRNDAAAAKDYIDDQQLDADMKTALWSLFDSKARSAIKAVSTTKKAA